MTNKAWTFKFDLHLRPRAVRLAGFFMRATEVMKGMLPDAYLL
jgi:hypothetical protein